MNKSEFLTNDSYYQIIYLPNNKSEDFANDEEVDYKYRNLFNRLAEYESTGLSPEEIIEFKNKLTDLKKRGDALDRRALYLKAYLGHKYPKITLRRIENEN